jgi:hypothetical protein
MSATTRSATDAPQGQGEDFNAVFAEMTAARDAEPAAGQGEPARQEQPATPEAEDEGRATPPRDERGRFTTPQQETPAPPAQEPAQPEQPAEPPADLAAQLAAERARREELERNYGGNLRQKDAEIQALRQREAQARQQWEQDLEQRTQQARQAQRDTLNQQIAAALARGELTEQDAQIHRDRLEGQFARDDNARLQAQLQALQQGTETERAADRARYQDALLPFVLPQVMQAYVPQFAARASALRGVAITPEEAAAFLSEPGSRQAYEQAWRMPLPPGAKEQYFESIEQQQAGLLAERSRLAAERREFERQRQLAANRAAAAGNGATRELVPGSAGPTDPDLARFQSRPGNEGDHFDALWAATRQEQ